jgi:hypothetical protein
MQYLNRSYSRIDHYRRLAIAARLRAAQAVDPSVKAAFEEVSSNWLALAEQVEWLQRNNGHMEERISLP